MQDILDKAKKLQEGQVLQIHFEKEEVDGEGVGTGSRGNEKGHLAESGEDGVLFR